MLSRHIAERLVQLLDSEDDSLQKLLQSFNSMQTSEQTSALLAISAAFTDVILNHCQQIVAFWFIYNSYPGPFTENPFEPLFHDYYTNASPSPNIISPSLHRILALVYQGKSIQFLESMNVLQVLRADLPLAWSKESPNTTSAKINQRVSPVIIEQKTNSDYMTPYDFLVEYLTTDGIGVDFEPPFLRPAPEIAPLFPEELCYLDSLEMPFLFDHSSTRVAQDMLQRACTTKLKESEAKTLINEIKRSPELADPFRSNEQLAKLIEKNSNIASELIMIIAQKKPSVFEFVASLPVCVSTVEVAKSLLMSSAAPPSFIQQYIHSGISSIQDPQKSRLFCRFLSFLKQQNVAFGSNISVELKTFCLDMSKKGVSEAQDLFNLL